jgi:hypothetical protein
VKIIFKYNETDRSLILLIAAIVSVPLITDYVLLGESTAASLAHIENIYRSLGKVFPVRLGAMSMSPYGYSMAAFQADLFYRIPAVLRLLGVSLGSAFKITLLLFNIITPFIAFGCFENIFGDGKTGMVASMLYTWCPYRITSLYISGNLSAVFAWTFIPVVLLGLWQLYEGKNTDEGTDNAPWITLTWGFSLLLLSSTVVFFVTACITLFFILLMWKKTLKKYIALQLVITVFCTVVINAWFLFPMLLRMRDSNAVGAMIAQNIQNLGMYILQYFKMFNFGGTSSDFWKNGIKNTVAYEPGAAVSILVLIYLGLWFTGRMSAAENKKGTGCEKAVLGAGIAAMILSSGSFPWDIFQNKNMFFSIALALMENPARWGIVADVCLIVTAGYTLVVIRNLYGEKAQLWAIIAVTAVSYGTTQFLTGQILSTENFVKGDDITAFGNIEMPVIYGESIIWRLCEALSVISVAVLFAMWLVKRVKHKNKA